MTVGRVGVADGVAKERNLSVGRVRVAPVLLNAPTGREEEWLASHWADWTEKVSDELYQPTVGYPGVTHPSERATISGDDPQNNKWH
jgi:hypothetical protein